jgi:hypothetical protein
MTEISALSLRQAAGTAIFEPGGVPFKTVHVVGNAKAAGGLGVTSICRERQKMTNALLSFLDHPQLLVVIGTTVLIHGLIGLALFIPTDVESTEDRLFERPGFFDKEVQGDLSVREYEQAGRRP